MAEYLVRNRWLIGLRGFLAILFGIMAFIWPGQTAIALIFLFAVYAVFDGILTIAGAFRNREINDRWWLGLLEGLVDIAAGVLAALFPETAAVAVVLIIAAWAVITGLLEIAAAIRLREEIKNEWALGLTGIVSILLGAILVLNPGAGIVGLVWAIGAYAVIFGILMVYLAISAGRFRTVDSGGARVYTK